VEVSETNIKQKTKVKCMNKKVKLGMVIIAATTAYAQIEWCQFTANLPCGGDTHSEGPCDGLGNQEKWTNDWTSFPNMNFCAMIGLGAGNTGCQSEAPVSCTLRNITVDCWGNRTVIPYPAFSATPKHAGGGSPCS
jgi:hypothetical protein